jgi:hypothetical protein
MNQPPRDTKSDCALQICTVRWLLEALNDTLSLFAFDPTIQAIFLVASDKAANWLADERFAERQVE